MSEVAGLLAGGETTKRYDIPINHLDYTYIQQCSDVKELEKILKVLRSGEEGIYPEMERQCEEKITSINPNSRLLRKDQPILTTKDLEKDEQSRIKDELSSWSQDIKSREETLKTTKTQKIDITEENGLPPVRAAGTTSSSNTTKSKPSNKRVKPRDYREWDKINVDAELEKIDKDDQSAKTSSKMSKGEPAQVSKDEVKGMSEEERTLRAEREKDKGNEEFKAGDIKEALSYYNRSLAYLPALASYNNRALAYVKLKLWDEAIADCNTVLKMEPSNIKALLRRGLSYKGKALYTECESDLTKVLEMEPQNKRAKDLLDEMTKERLKHQKEVQSTKAPPSSKGKRMVIEETDGSSSESEEEPPAKRAPQPATSTNTQGNSTGKQKVAKEPPNKATPVDKTIDLKSSLLLNGGVHEEEAINPNITLDVNKSKNRKGKILIEEISNADTKQSESNNVSTQEQSEVKTDTVCIKPDLEVLAAPRQRLELVQKALPPQVDRLKAAGGTLFKAGQYGDAMQKYSQAIDKLPQDDVVNLSLLYSNLAACKSKIGDCRGCVEASTKSLELVPHAVKPLLRRADAYEHSEKYDKAYVDYRHILNMDSSVEIAQRGSTRCAAELRNVKGIRWREGLPPIPSPALEDIPLVTTLAAAQASTPQSPQQPLPGQQESTPRQSLKTNSELFEECKSEGNEFVKKGKFKEAAEKYSHCIELFPDSSVAYTNRALCYLRLNKASKAKDDCSQALKHDDKNVKALFRRGQAYKVLKQYQDSFSDLRNLLKVDPKNAAAKKEMQLVLKYISEENEKTKTGKSSTGSKKRVNIKEVGSSDDED